MSIRISMLGGFRIESAGRTTDALDLGAEPAAVLAIIAAHGAAARREIEETVWPELSPGEAERRLREALATLRQELGPGWVRNEQSRLTLAPDVHVDVLEVAAAAAEGDVSGVRRHEGGEFLEGADPRLPAAMQRWVLHERGRIADLRTARRRPGEDGQEPGDGLVRALNALRRRPAVRWAVGYLAGAVLLLEAGGILTDAFDLPSAVLRVMALLLTIGALLALALAWVHGRRAGRRLGWPELLLAVVVLLFVGWEVRQFREMRSDREARPARGDPELDPRRLAVLFFEDRSPGQDMGHIAAGLTEQLISELGEVEALEVLSRTAVAPYRQQQVPYDSLIAVLRAGTLVEGSVSRVDDRIRLSVQLVDGATAAQMHSTTLERPADSVAQLLEDLPREVSLLLRERLGRSVQLRESRAATSSGPAWTLVQRARQLVEDGEAVGWADRHAGLSILEQADSMLAAAEALDPDWPEPTVRRAEVEAIRARSLAGVPSMYDSAATRAALGHLDRVLNRHPDHVPALEERGILKFQLFEGGHGDLPDLQREAEADLRRAVLLDPERARAWWGLSRVLRRRNSLAEAKRAAARAVDADAFLAYSLQNLFHLWHVNFDLEAFDEARRWCAELRQRYPDRQQWGYCEIYMLVTDPGTTPDVDRAWTAADTIVALAPGSARPVYRAAMSIQVAKVLVRAGLPDSARALVASAVPTPVPEWALYDLAHLELLLGEWDRSLDLLERFARWNPGRAASLGEDHWFRPLHGHPRLQRILGLGPG